LAFSCHMALVLLVSPFLKDQVEFNIASTRPIIRFSFWILGIRLIVEGAENIPEDRSFIVVANHQSHVDIPAFLLAIRRPFGFVAKKELLNVPIVGWDIRSQGHIAIDRKNPAQSRHQLQSLVTDISTNKKNLVIFAEGTRSATGKLGKFKLGAFDLAAKSGTVIVPASITGSYNVLNKKSMVMKPGTIRIRIHPVVPPPSAEAGGLESARERVAAIIQADI